MGETLPSLIVDYRLIGELLPSESPNITAAAFGFDEEIKGLFMIFKAYNIYSFAGDY